MNLQTRFWDLQTKFWDRVWYSRPTLSKRIGAPPGWRAPHWLRALSIKAASRLYGMVVLQNKYFTLYPFSMVGGCALPHAS